MRLLGYKFPRVAENRGKLYAESKHAEFMETLVHAEGATWRLWDPRRSKLGAAIVKNMSQFGLREGDSVLYLGAAHGYTAGFVADIVGEKGVVFAVDFSPRVMRDLVHRARERTNIIPILGDARKPDQWSHRVTGVDVLIMDVAQPDQVGIFKRAVERFVTPGGFGLLALKARSVDSAKNPQVIFKEVFKELGTWRKVVDYRELAPFEKDHAFYVVKNDKPSEAEVAQLTQTREAPRKERSYDRGDTNRRPRRW